MSMTRVTVAYLDGVSILECSDCGPVGVCLGTPEDSANLHLSAEHNTQGAHQ